MVERGDRQEWLACVYGVVRVHLFLRWNVWKWSADRESKAFSRYQVDMSLIFRSHLSWASPAARPIQTLVLTNL